MSAHRPCPCGLPAAYDACCGRFHRGEAAPTAELLMRSRYSAFAVGDADHLARTWHPDTRPHRIRVGDPARWRGLDVIASAAGGLLDQEGTVEFRAMHADGDHHELSRFTRVEKRWVYVGAAP